MATVTLYSPEAPGLKLGPGRAGSEDCLVFVDGYADVADDDLPRVMDWIRASGPNCPPIRILDASEGRLTDPAAPRCDQCGRAFADDRALRAHLLSHRRR